jgi:hypothetical protein
MDMRRLLLILFTVVACSFFSCEKNEEVNNTTSRLFRPASFGLDTNASTGNEIILTWMPIGNATYLLELCTSETFEEGAPVWSIPLENVSRYVVMYEEIIEHLGYQANVYYGVRIKSIGSDPNVKDSEYATARFRFTIN